MINLIPIEEKKEIKKDFFYRFLSVVFFILVFLNFVSLVAMFPAYFMSLEKKKLINKKLEIQKNETIPEIDQQAVVAIKNLDTRLALLEKAKNSRYLFSEKVIKQILSEKVSGIKISGIFYEKNLPEGRKIKLMGLAENREQLLLFRKALENDSSFEDVDLPISNFVKGNNIEFSLDLISK